MSASRDYDITCQLPGHAACLEAVSSLTCSQWLPRFFVPLFLCMRQILCTAGLASCVPGPARAPVCRLRLMGRGRHSPSASQGLRHPPLCCSSPTVLCHLLILLFPSLPLSVVFTLTLCVFGGEFARMWSSQRHSPASVTGHEVVFRAVSQDGVLRLQLQASTFQGGW